jgi:predicted nucleic acid-binding protein
MKPRFVVDCSVALTWCFVEEATPATDNLLDRMENEAAAVPTWWFLELANVLVLAERKGRIKPQKTAEFITMIEGLPLERDDEGAGFTFTQLLPLCRTHELTSYDALYLDLALRRKLPLATLDEPLRKAAKKIGVELLGK